MFGQHGEYASWNCINIVDKIPANYSALELREFTTTHGNTPLDCGNFIAERAVVTVLRTMYERLANLIVQRELSLRTGVVVELVHVV